MNTIEQIYRKAVATAKSAARSYPLKYREITSEDYFQVSGNYFDVDFIVSNQEVVINTRQVDDIGVGSLQDELRKVDKLRDKLDSLMCKIMRAQLEESKVSA